MATVEVKHSETLAMEMKLDEGMAMVGMKLGESKHGEAVTTVELKLGEPKQTERRRGGRRKTNEDKKCLIPRLPNEIALLCLARVPRARHHVLSAVCKSWWELLHDKVFSDVRQELSLAEEWLFLWTQDAFRCNVWHGFDPTSNKWFELPALPNEHRTAGSSASAVVDGKLFVIGGQLISSGNACNFVSFFDMRHYCWKTAANLNIARAKCMAGVINGQLYVVGGFTERDQNAGATAEAYDPATNQWRLISSMKIPMELYDSAVLGGKFYVVNSSSENLVGLVYDPQKDEWVDMANGLNTGWQSKTAALNGKLYAVGDSHSSEGKNEISVYNASKDLWESIKGVLDDSAPVLSWGPELVSLGGRLCIVGTGSRAAVAVVEINESAKTTVANLTFYDDITRKIQFTDPLPRGACQVFRLDFLHSSDMVPLIVISTATHRAFAALDLLNFRTLCMITVQVAGLSDTKLGWPSKEWTYRYSIEGSWRNAVKHMLRGWSREKFDSFSLYR